MTLFSRRTLQRVLEENASFLSAKQLSNACGLLNKAHDNYLATEWEQVILNAASKFGAVQHEPQLGSSKVDLLFRSTGTPFEFIADITAASDQGFYDLNPIDPLEIEFWRRVRKSGWLLGGFHTEIDAHTRVVYRGADDRIRLKIPKRTRWDDEIFNSRFDAFLRNVKQQPEQGHRFDVVSPETGIHITYDPAKRGTSGSTHLAYALATVIDRNPIYHALKGKLDQIKKTRYEGMAGIFLCEGGCQMLSANPNSTSFSIDDVIRYFFRQSDSVWFVCVFGVKEDGLRASVRAKLHLNPKKRRTDFTPLERVVDNICKSIPELQFSPYNARYRVKSRNLSGRYYGNWEIGGHVKMSAREMLEILAGVKTVAQFEENYQMKPHENPFRRMLEKGRLISKVTVERLPGKDDDVVTVDFGDSDAAIAPFQLL